MKRPARLVVGLTGGIAAGKSTALAAMAESGAATISLDQIAREQARPGNAAYAAIVRAFGTCILKADGTIDRALLGRVVFSDARARKGLERLTHPLILRELDRLLKSLSGVVVVDVPLLYEKGLERRFDAVAVVSCPPAEQLRRLVRRDRMPRAEALRRIRAQWPTARKAARADFVLDNSRTPAALRAQARAYARGLHLLYGGTPNGNQDPRN